MNQMLEINKAINQHYEREISGIIKVRSRIMMDNKKRHSRLYTKLKPRVALAINKHQCHLKEMMIKKTNKHFSLISS